MPNPLSLIPRAVGQSQPQIVHGYVSSTQPAPASFTSPLYVVIPQWNPDYFWKLTSWPASNGRTLPAAGNECLLGYDDLRNLWCIAWKATYS